MVASAFACCIFGLAVNGAEVAVKGASSAESMYRAEVVGVLLTAEKMYHAGEVARWSGELRVDEVISGGQPKAGQVIALEYPSPAARRAMATGVGSQVQAKISAQAAAKGKALRWVAEETLKVLGRGELIRPGEGAAADLGSPEAKILVKMLAPMRPECHRETANLLKALAQREPERVRVQLFDMASPAGRVEMQREGLSCATVLVNNRYEFVLAGPEGERKVALWHRANSPQASYNSADAVAVVEQEIKRLYPE
jgi:hypothetical protein